MVKALRVDERLIHGQVAMAWTRDLGIQESWLRTMRLLPMRCRK